MLMLAAPCWAVRGIVPPFQYRSPSRHDWTGRGSLPGFVVNTIASSSSVACQAWYCAPKQPARKSWALDSIAPDGVDERPVRPEQLRLPQGVPVDRRQRLGDELPGGQRPSVPPELDVVGLGVRHVR